MAHRKKWYETRVMKFLENGGGDGRGAATATEMIEYLRNHCGKRQLPSTGAISHSLRGVRSTTGGRVFQEVGLTKVARGDSRKRGYMVTVWALANNNFLSELRKKYKPAEKRE